MEALCAGDGERLSSILALFTLLPSVASFSMSQYSVSLPSSSAGGFLPEGGGRGGRGESSLIERLACAECEWGGEG